MLDGYIRPEPALVDKQGGTHGGVFIYGGTFSRALRSLEPMVPRLVNLVNPPQDDVWVAGDVRGITSKAPFGGCLQPENRLGDLGNSTWVYGWMHWQWTPIKWVENRQGKLKRRKDYEAIVKWWEESDTDCIDWV